MYYQTFQVHIPEDTSKKTSKKIICGDKRNTETTGNAGIKRRETATSRTKVNFESDCRIVGQCILYLEYVQHNVAVNTV